MINKKYKIFISATEQSGDNIGYNIINELLNSNNQYIFDGIGGFKMAPLMNKQFYNLKDFNAMGIIEVIFSIKRYIKMINFLLKKILFNKYDLIITIDSPDFNYPLAKKVKKNIKNIKLIHIVAPSVWAWRSNRAKKFAKIFDELLVLYSFETKYFTKHNLKTTLIGHPIYYIQSTIPFKLVNINIAFLPGSRMSEVKRLLPYFTLAYKYILKELPNSNIFFPTLPHLEEYIQKYVSNWKIKVIITTNLSQINDIYRNTSHALVCSGTASLEIAKRNIPQLVIYKFNIITELILKMFVNVKYANIFNIIVNKMIIPEVTNSNLTPYNFIKEFDKLIKSKNDNDFQITEVKRILETFKCNQPPYVLASKRINDYLS